MTESTKSRGADIRCVICGREPFADDPALECHELRRFGPDGGFADSPKAGEWRCPEHAPAKPKRAARAVRGSPLEALGDFELLLADMTAQLVEALPGDDDDNRDDVEAAVKGFSHEIAGGLHQLRAAIVAHAKPVAKDKLKSRRKTIVATEHQPGQSDLMEVPGDTS
jgi:hypothetical protein